MRPTWFGRKRHVNSFIVRVFAFYNSDFFFIGFFCCASLGILFSVVLILELGFLFPRLIQCMYVLGFDLSVEWILEFGADFRFFFTSLVD